MKRIELDATTLNTIVGAIGITVGISRDATIFFEVKYENTNVGEWI